MKVLWLASWYPNVYEPYSGDFIQRHANAVAALLPVDVIHVLQLGHKVNVAKDEVLVNKQDGLTEYVHAFKFNKFGLDFLDKLRYNIIYHRYYKNVIRHYIKQNGKPDLVHVHVPVKAGLIAIDLLKQYGRPFIVSEHSSHYDERSADYFFNRSKYFQRNTKKVIEQAAAVTNVSATIGKKLQSMFKIKNYRTVHNLVDTSLFYYKPKEREERIRFLHVSSMNEQKNPSGIIKALAKFDETNKNWECVFCGPVQEDLKRLANSLQLDHKIKFTGEITYKEVAVQMQLADVFILFSNHENFPCVVIEALCCGLPVITSNAGGVAEAVNASNGLVIEIENTNQLTEALTAMVNNVNEYNAQTIALAAVKLYKKEKIAVDFIDLYKNLLNKNDEKPQRR